MALWIRGCSVRTHAYVVGATLLLIAPAVPAQVIGGRVVDAASRRPLPRVSVRLMRIGPADTAALPTDTMPAARSYSAADGVFTLIAPDTGTYRVRIGDGFVGPATRLASTEAFDEHEYPVTFDLQRSFFDFQVQKQAATRPGTVQLHYPGELQEAGIQGKVVVQFVVDTLERAEMGTFKVLESNHPLFTAAARAAVAGGRFVPAELAGRKVRQLVQLPLTFSLDDTPPILPPSPPLRGRRGDPREASPFGVPD